MSSGTRKISLFHKLFLSPILCNGAVDVRLEQGVFLPVFKKLKAALKKLKPIFGQKLNAMEATLNIKKKTQKVLMEISRIYSKVHGIFNKFVEFSKY